MTLEAFWNYLTVLITFLGFLICSFSSVGLWGTFNEAISYPIHHCQIKWYLSQGLGLSFLTHYHSILEQFLLWFFILILLLISFYSYHWRFSFFFLLHLSYLRRLSSYWTPCRKVTKTWEHRGLNHLILEHRITFFQNLIINTFPLETHGLKQFLWIFKIDLFSPGNNKDQSEYSVIQIVNF